MERKDSRGRILRKGEYERKNGYAFRQSDQATGEVSWCYAKTLNELRKRERQLVEDSVSGVKRVGRKKKRSIARDLLVTPVEEETE